MLLSTIPRTFALFDGHSARLQYNLHAGRRFLYLRKAYLCEKATDKSDQWLIRTLIDSSCSETYNQNISINFDHKLHIIIEATVDRKMGFDRFPQTKSEIHIQSFVRHYCSFHRPSGIFGRMLLQMHNLLFSISRHTNRQISEGP